MAAAELRGTREGGREKGCSKEGKRPQGERCGEGKLGRVRGEGGGSKSSAGWKPFWGIEGGGEGKGREGMLSGKRTIGM